MSDSDEMLRTILEENDSEEDSEEEAKQMTSQLEELLKDVKSKKLH